MPRTAEIHRKTKETDIRLKLDVDGSGASDVRTGIPFFDHMLILFSKHGLMDLSLEADGDLEIDFHHTVEDTGIVLGQALKSALGDKAGITRYGHAYVPMDETLARVVCDFSGRPFVCFESPGAPQPVGNFPFQLVEEFLRGVAVHAGLNLHATVLYGKDTHHMAEAIFKALGKAIDFATTVDPRVQGVPSTKGTLD